MKLVVEAETEKEIQVVFALISLLWDRGVVHPKSVTVQ
jgi:hypothetical protein